MCFFSNSRKRSPKQKKQLNGDVTDADRDKLITDCDGTYRKYPGVNNIAYVVLNLHVFIYILFRSLDL